ncbi:MAG: AMP-binding protein, partial [Pyrinomonadaceae bacterium]|nr:AMP-binding protein [Pyrinomonadaceae bacterium]
ALLFDRPDVDLDLDILIDLKGDEYDSVATNSTGIANSASDSAYIMYTSGTTGEPKGAIVSHGALSSYALFAAKKYGKGGDCIFPFFTSIGFDLTLTSIFAPLLSGGRIVVYPEADFGPDLAVIEVVEQNKVNSIKLTPSHLALLENHDFEGSNIQTFVVGGEDFKTETASSVSRRFEDRVEIFNEYGPTEATVGCVLHQFDLNERSASVPIGRPVAGASIYILDEKLNPVPRGTAGRLLIGGTGLADGYFGREELTRERFVSNPFVENETLYDSGDLAFRNDEGILEYLGRTDEQVKIGGIRTEPREIEIALQSLEGVDEVCVTSFDTSAALAPAVSNCVDCGLPDNYPGVTFDENGVCSLCRSFENFKKNTAGYFKTPEELETTIRNGSTGSDSDYDCLALLSGGKDSTYALAVLASMGFRVLAFTLDNGYISEQAKENIRRVVNELGVDHVFGSTPEMNAIFRDSLARFSNVCNGCFKTIYTLSAKIAWEKNIPFIVTGLSRGQFFETRLTEELFTKSHMNGEIDAKVLEARKQYHRANDTVNRLLDNSVFLDDDIFDRVKFLDFYRYVDVSVSEMLEYLDTKLPWVRPTDTGRSTNCLINQVGIYVHKKEKGFSNYAFPYSWDVRIGHKTRDESLEEIDEEIDVPNVKKIMSEIGYERTQRNEMQLAAFYTGSLDRGDIR